MNSKIFEIRDRMTYIPVLATKMCSELPEERYHLRRLGYGTESNTLIMITRLSDHKSEFSDYGWYSLDRTMQAAHEYIEKHFDELETGAVVDVEYILGESDKPKESERFWHG